MTAAAPSGVVTFLFTDVEGFDPSVGGLTRRHHLGRQQRQTPEDPNDRHGHSRVGGSAKAGAVLRFRSLGAGPRPSLVVSRCIWRPIRRRTPSTNTAAHWPTSGPPQGGYSTST